MQSTSRSLVLLLGVTLMGFAAPASVDLANAVNTGQAEQPPGSENSPRTAQSTDDPLKLIPATQDMVDVVGQVDEKPGGNGEAEARIELWPHLDGKNPYTRTDPNGSYRFPKVEPGVYTMRIIDRTTGVWSEGVVVRVANDSVQAEKLYLRLPQSVSGTITDAETGQPVAGVDLRFSTADRNWNSVQTDDRGRYRLYVTPREVRVQCQGTDERYYGKKEDSQNGRAVQVAANKPVQSVDFQVRSAPKFTGKVLLPDGQQAPQCRQNSGGRRLANHSIWAKPSPLRPVNSVANIRLLMAPEVPRQPWRQVSLSDSKQTHRVNTHVTCVNDLQTIRLAAG
jgi:hypothetical protein